MEIDPFTAHAGLLDAFLHNHEPIVERIESRLLNVQGKNLSRGTRQQLDRLLEACVYELPGLPPDAARLRGQLAALHLADGFEPVILEQAAHALDPAGLVARAHRQWSAQRWAGRNGRLAFARVVFGVFILRQLEALSLRVWDQGTGFAGERLDRVQRLLDGLNRLIAPHVLVRDARWLIQTAQGPLTRHLAPYFRIAGHIAESWTPAARREVHVAGVKLAGGHLRSQLRYRSAELNLPGNHPDVLAITRNSNAMDVALLVRDLVPLLEAYTAALVSGDDNQRLALADAILQGISADPGLLVTRLDLLGPCATLETLFISNSATGDDGPRHTELGRTHLAALARYRELIGQAAAALKADAGAFEPTHYSYSPLGIAYGFCADILSIAAASRLAPASASDPSLEDMFDGRGNTAEKRARADAWQRLPSPHAEHEPFQHSVEWAQAIFAQTIAALDARAARPADANASDVPGARLFVVPRDVTVESLPKGFLPDGIAPAQEHCLTSDVNRAFGSGATAFPKSQILRDRNEGRFLASAETGGKWFAVSKTVLTALLGEGRNALIADVPPTVINGLALTCPELIVIAPSSDQT